MTSDSHLTRPCVAYVLGTFPAVTETFIHREIRAMQKRGIGLFIFAVRRAKNAKIAEPLCDLNSLRSCSYARPDRLFPHFLANITSLLRHPLRYLSVLKLFVSQGLALEPARYFRLLYHFYCGIGFAGEMKQVGVNIIHCHFTAGSNIGLAASMFLGLPFSITVHASDDIFVKPVLLEEKLSRACFIVADSEYALRYADSITDYRHSPKFHRIYNSFDLNGGDSSGLRLTPPSETETCRVASTRIVSVGSLVGCKGHATLLNACRILKQRGHRFLCQIAGDGEDREFLLNLIEKWDLEHSVELLGCLPLDSVYALLNQSKVFALLSEIQVSGYRDGLPTAILEAMAFGLPVVSTYISGISEVVTDGQTGFLVPERDPIAAADALERLILDEELRERLGSEGRRSLERFAGQEPADSLAQLFAELGSPDNKLATGCAQSVAEISVTQVNLSIPGETKTT